MPNHIQLSTVWFDCPACKRKSIGTTRVLASGSPGKARITCTHDDCGAELPWSICIQKGLDNEPKRSPLTPRQRAKLNMASQ